MKVSFYHLQDLHHPHLSGVPDVPVDSDWVLQGDEGVKHVEPHLRGPELTPHHPLATRHPRGLTRPRQGPLLASTWPPTQL